MRTLIGKRRNRLTDSGYLLPVVIALGMAISVGSISALGVVSQNSKTLNTQYYSELALEAARAGSAAATKCIEVGTFDWDTGGKPKLGPQTDCHGANVAGRPTTVLDDGSIQSTYNVKAIDSSYGGNTRILTSTGTTTIKDPAGRTITLATKSVRTLGQLNGFGGKTVTAISSGYEHTCAVLSGQAFCWGNNQYGQLGNGTPNLSTIPVAVNTAGVLKGHTVTDVAAGDYISCAVADGKAYCWGYGGYGELGNGSSANSSVPVAVNDTGVLAGKTVTAISVGGDAEHVCAIASGQAYCWGYNGYGELGNGTNTSSNVPVAVNMSGVLAGKTVTAISAGYDYTCVVASGQAYCWGYNGYGELGNNTTTNSNVPVAVASGPGNPSSPNPCGGFLQPICIILAQPLSLLNGKTVTAISAGLYHTCSIASGQAYCWGYNGYGQLGNNSTNSSTMPVAVDTTGVLNGHTVTDISASMGDYFSCAVADGKAYCWGYDSGGELGDGTNSYYSQVPVAVVASGVLNGKSVAAISGGGDEFACAIANGQAYCWGNNLIWGMLGNGAWYGNSNVPVTVGVSLGALNTSVTTLDAGGYHSCAVISGQAYCWGYDGDYELGNNSTTISTIPVPVSTSGVLNLQTVTDISAGYAHSCAIASGQAYCWGYNAYGELGNNSTTTSPVPVAVLAGAGSPAVPSNPNPCGGFLQPACITQAQPAVPASPLYGKTVTSISAGEYHTCVIASGLPYCWGYNAYGQLGNNSTTNSSIPVAVNMSGVLAGKTVTSISAGLYHTCVVASGQSYCWGYNGYGELGNNSTTSSSVPVAVTSGPGNPSSPNPCGGFLQPVCVILAQPSSPLNGKTVTEISAGMYHTCVAASGQAYCWGYNANGQLGNNSGTSSSIPVTVSTAGVLGGHTVTDISASTGDGFSCAVADGKAYCWGDNASGQLGNNSTSSSSVPVAVLAGAGSPAVPSNPNPCGGFLQPACITQAQPAVPASPLNGKTVTSISTGDMQFACAIASGQGYCWGNNSLYGMLGNGTWWNGSLIPVTVYAPDIAPNTYTFNNPVTF